jgi:ABC-type branched-subunit amino acid transport system ATPase component
MVAILGGRERANQRCCEPSPTYFNPSRGKIVSEGRRELFADLSVLENLQLGHFVKRGTRRDSGSSATR